MTTSQAPRSDFGANEWLVYEMYQQYLADPGSVDPAWHDFLADYTPVGGTGPAAATAPTAEPARAAVAEPAATPEPAPAAVAEPAAGREAAPAPVTTATPTPGPIATATPAPAHAVDVPAGRPAPPPPPTGADIRPIRGIAARVAANMETSLAVPTATSVRAVPAKLLADNRLVINNHLGRARGGKVSFTHIIGFALTKALAELPEMNNAYAEVDGKPVLVLPEHVHLGIAIDLPKQDGSRSLVVPSIKHVDGMDFAHFWAAYEDVVRRARVGRLTTDDYAGTTITITNPGTIGTVHSVPRLMQGQGCILGVGAMEHPAQFSGASAETLARLAVSKVMTLTSTYDHRIIQGAQSGDFLRRIHELLLGAEGFYDEIFSSLRIPYEPIQWAQDIAASHEDEVGKPARVVELIHAYRVRGHLMADTNPLEFELRRHPDLDVVTHGLTLWDLDREFPTGGFGGKPIMRLREILDVLRDSYCRRIGIEYMHIQDPEQREWIQARCEHPLAKPDRAEQLRILGKLNEAEAFETFLQTKFVGQKRFSLEGSESMIPLVDAVIALAAGAGLDEVVIGMPHRGRLNVLANIVGKSYAQIFREFEGYMDPETIFGSGDVKYHLGADGQYVAHDGSAIAVSLACNPSHLEAVDPVLEGIVRAKQDVLDKGEDGYTVLPLMLHGDAAFAGQGVVAETLNLSQLRGYRTGGTVHLIVNNQVGFTTSPQQSRSSVYSTDIARMIQAPIFHVNGDDPEACVRVGQLAFEFRQAFRKDVVVDMVCYRRRGHNEADEPSFTQPLMYELIDAKRSVRKIYTESLVGRRDITIEEAEESLRDYQQHLERIFTEARRATAETPAPPGEADRPEPVPQPAVDTAVDLETVKRIVGSQVSLPEGFFAHRRLLPQLQRRAALLTEPADWATGELLAFGSLLLEGRPVRLAGQDSRRGTFGHRNAAVVDQRTGEHWLPLAHLAAPGEQGHFHVYDSLLSEYAAMGFEYGYSVARPDALVMWEAQFGDFADGAQTILDEFISCGETKWGQRTSLVLLLPHGWEGQGPDHSSARLERYLQLCAEDNMRVAVPTTPASYFHLLRRQARTPERKPLVVFTPKSLLRLRAARSPVGDFTSGSFRPLVPDATVGDPAAVHRVLLCAGKVYYDLLVARERAGRTDTAIVRLEQLYPTPVAEIQQALRGFPNLGELVWVQEEPANQGAWQYLACNLPEHLPLRLHRASRPAAAAPASGSHQVHEAEQAELMAAAFPA